MNGFEFSMHNSRTSFAALSLFISLFICALGLLSGCSTMNQMTAGPADRQQLLTELLPKFHRSVYWAQFEQAAAFVTPEARAEFVSKNESARRKENLVELEIDNVEFGPEAETAQVDVVVRYFKNPTYMVESRREQETWKFTRGDGWLYHSAKDLGPAASGDEAPALRGRM